MRMTRIVDCPEWIMREEEERPIALSPAVYLERLDLLVKRMQAGKLDYVVIYGDREHFASIEYFSKYDCRFEEGLLIVSGKGEKTIVVGNEGMALSYEIPYEVNRVLYRNFSLQGQPRENSPKLRDVFENAGIGKGSAVGVVGVKYFGKDVTDDPAHTFDVPEYIMGELYKATSKENVINFTEEITGMPNGIRLEIRRAEEIAYIDYQAARTANVMRRLIKNARPGISETELSRLAEAELTPVQMFPLINLTDESLSRGLRSPSPFNKLSVGGGMGFCYSQRGSLCSKVGLAAYDEDSINENLKGKLESFYMQHWLSIAAWYETVRVGAKGGEIYEKVTALIGDPSFGLALNPGHYIGMDEWVNSNVYEGSELPLMSGSHLQSDIIASSSDPVMVSICEDTVVIADEQLRSEVAKEYPELFEKIKKRQQMMRQVLNINISDDVLPMSSLNGVMFPFLLNSGKIYAQ